MTTLQSSEAELGRTALCPQSPERSLSLPAIPSHATLPELRATSGAVAGGVAQVAPWPG